MKKIIVDVKSKTFKRITYRAYDKKGNLIPVKTQVSLMKSDPSSFGYGVVDVGNELEFINIKSNYLLFSYHNWIKDVNKHLSDKDACKVLSHIKNNVVLGLDYNDIRNNKCQKCLLVEYNEKIYLLGLNTNQVDRIQIVKISTLYNKDDYFHLKDYLYKTVAKKRRIYKNKKSNDFLRRFPLTREGVFKTTTTVNNYKHK